VPTVPATIEELVSLGFAPYCDAAGRNYWIRHLATGDTILVGRLDGSLTCQYAADEVRGEVLPKGASESHATLAEFISDRRVCPELENSHDVSAIDEARAVAPPLRAAMLEELMDGLLDPETPDEQARSLGTVGRFEVLIASKPAARSEWQISQGQAEEFGVWLMEGTRCFYGTTTSRIADRRGLAFLAEAERVDLVALVKV
jgi:hypothetical protein